MATVVCGVVIAAILAYALHHIWDNFAKGTSDCCKTSCGGSCSGSCGGCSGCHPK